MIISDASAVYYGDSPVSRVYCGEKLVYGHRNFITSKNNLTDGGFTVGDPVTKDATTVSNYTTSASRLPGTQDLTATRQYWPDWGGDIFDGWGLWYLYDPTQDNYKSVILASPNTADGVVNTQTVSFNGRTFTFNYGYPVQGVFKFDIKVNDNSTPFQFGFDGNLGSNGTTTNTNLTETFTLDGEDFTLHYNHNIESGNPPEDFYTYVVPYETYLNKSTVTFNKGVYDTDKLYLYSKPVTKGVTIYIAKHNDVKDWIINDLQLTSWDML